MKYTTALAAAHLHIATLSTAWTQPQTRALFSRFPCCYSGRVKTLHPGVHGGILAKRDEELHMAAISEHKISPIDIVVVNLYPFRQTVTAEQAPSYETAVENIDIGKSLLRLHYGLLSL